MLYTHFTEKLLGLKGVIVKNITQPPEYTSIDIEIEPKPHNCPCCGTATRTIHDYRQQKIKDIPAFWQAYRAVSAKKKIQMSKLWETIL